MTPEAALTLARRTLGPNLRQLRLSQGIGLRETARRTGMLPSTLHRVECGELDLRGSTSARRANATLAHTSNEPPTGADRQAARTELLGYDDERFDDPGGDDADDLA